MPESNRSQIRSSLDEDAKLYGQGRSDRHYQERHDDDRHRSRHRSSRHQHRSTSREARTFSPGRYRHRDTLIDDTEDRRRKHKSYRDRSSSFDPPSRRRTPSPPSHQRRRRSNSRSRSPRPRKSRGPLPSQNDSFDQQRRVANGDAPLPEKHKPNFKPTGLLAKEANTVAGTSTVLKYHEPNEARKPSSKTQWRLYVFKNKDLLDTIHLYQRSAWLTGRDPKVTDLRIDHPSVSKQHAVIQFRYITTIDEFGDRSGTVKPYLIDLESANGTKLSSKKIDVSRYVELVDGDVITFGDSEREYVMMLPPS